METETRAVLVATIGVVGAVLLLALTVYPLQYGFVESVVLVGVLVLVALFETVLDDSSF